MRRRTVVIVVVALALATLGWGGYRHFYGRRSTAEEEAQTFTVERGRVVSTVSAVGGVAAQRRLDLTFQVSGRLVKLEVEEGQRVEAGQILARLDTSQLQLALAKAEANLGINKARLAEVEAGPTPEELASARANLASAQENLARVQAGPDEWELAAARQSVASAREKVAQVEAGPSQEQIAAAEASLKAAQESYRKLVASPTNEDTALAEAQLEQARLSLEKAKNSLWASQAERDAIQGRPSSPGYQLDAANSRVNAAEVAVQMAQVDYERAQINYALQLRGATAAELASALSQIEKASDALNQLKAQPTDSELAGAQAQLAQAESQLKALEASPTASDLAAAQAQLTQAQSQLERLEASPTAEELAIAEAQVEQAQLAVREAELRLRDAQIVAPFSGWVVSIEASESQVVGANKVILSLADLSKLEIEVAMDEIDVGQVKDGQQVMVTLDALPESRPTMGQVERVALAGTVSQGVVNYPVVISLDRPDPAIKPGMTANVHIVTEQKEDVLVVPNRAVRRKGQQTVVEVIRDGNRLEVPVTIGIADEDVSEVLEGLAEGEEVVIRGTSAGPVRAPVRGLGGMFGGGHPQGR